MTKRNKDANHKQLLDTIISNKNLFHIHYLYLTQKHLEKIYNEILGTKLPILPNCYSYGPVNKNVTTKIFDIVFSLIIDDMLNSNTNNYTPNIKYYKDGEIVKFIIHNNNSPSISEWDNIFSVDERDEILFNQKYTDINNQEFILADFIKNINFTQLELNEGNVNYYVQIIEKLYKTSNNLANINFLLKDHDPIDTWLLKNNLSDSAKVAINLYTTNSYTEINKVMFNCNELTFDNILYDTNIINLSLLTVAIASVALINLPIQPNIFIVNRHEYFNKSRIETLISCVKNGKILMSDSLTSTAIIDDLDEVNILIKTQRPYIAPLSACPNENEVLLPASQQIFLYAYKQTDEHHIVFVGETVNIVQDFIT